MKRVPAGWRRALLLGAATLAWLAFVTAAPPARAQTAGCDDPETVACIPTPPPPAASPAAAPAGAAAAFPVYVCPPPPLPPPYPVPVDPYPVPTPATAAPTTPPVPPYCYNDLYTTLNRANLAYARAMRSLDPSLLSPYWTQDALSNLIGQISSLQASGSYQVLRLRSIQVLDATYSAHGAWVHTSEHWTWETWSAAGYEYDSGDGWYDNQYFLIRTPFGWAIGTDLVQ